MSETTRWEVLLIEDAGLTGCGKQNGIGRALVLPSETAAAYSVDSALPLCPGLGPSVGSCTCNPLWRQTVGTAGSDRSAFVVLLLNIGQKTEHFSPGEMDHRARGASHDTVVVVNRPGIGGVVSGAAARRPAMHTLVACCSRRRAYGHRPSTTGAVRSRQQVSRPRSCRSPLRHSDALEARYHRLEAQGKLPFSVEPKPQPLAASAPCQLLEISCQWPVERTERRPANEHAIDSDPDVLTRVSSLRWVQRSPMTITHNRQLLTVSLSTAS
jgi:hypothetical protein